MNLKFTKDELDALKIRVSIELAFLDAFLLCPSSYASKEALECDIDLLRVWQSIRSKLSKERSDLAPPKEET